MLTAMLTGVGVVVVAMATVALLRREPRRARADGSCGGEDVSWMHAPGLHDNGDSCDTGGSDGGGCSGDGGGGGGGD